MALYYEKATDRITEIDEAVMAQWIATGNPKAGRFSPLPEKPAFDAATQKAPVLVGGQWTVPEKSPEEVKAEQDQTVAAETLAEIAEAAADPKGATLEERVARLEKYLALQS